MLYSLTSAQIDTFYTKNLPVPSYKERRKKAKEIKSFIKSKNFHNLLMVTNGANTNCVNVIL